MGGPWTITTGSQYLTAHDWGAMLAIAYGEAGWPSQCYRLWVWEAE